jgi:soluble lytic murein transglycosylase-like protein
MPTLNRFLLQTLLASCLAVLSTLSAPNAMADELLSVEVTPTQDSAISTPFDRFETEPNPVIDAAKAESLPKVSRSLKNPYADLVNLALTGKSNAGTKTYSDAVANYCKAARDDNDANAQFALGWLYTNGRGVEKNEDLAALFFKMAADQQHSSAQTWFSNSKGNASAASLPACMMPDPPANIASVHQAENEEPAQKREAKPFYTKGPIHKIVSKIAPQFQIDIDLVMAFIAVESGFNPQATSPKNAQGLMQLIPETAARFNVKDAYNPEENVKGGMSYLRWLLAHFKGDLALVAAAYNAGENAVVRYKGIPPYPETQAYVKKIISLYGASYHPYQSALGVKPAFMQASANEAWPKTKTTKP